MIRVGERLQLGDLRALGEGFPLRGSFRIVDAAGGRTRCRRRARDAARSG